MRYPATGYFIGRYYLRRYPGSSNWYVASFNSSTGQVDRTSLETTDLEAAKIAAGRLIAIHGEIGNKRPESVTLAQAFDRYHEHRSKELPSGREQRRHMDFWIGHFGQAATIADLHPSRQRGFVAALQSRVSDGLITRCRCRRGSTA